MPAFGDLLIVMAVAFAAPFVLGLFPKVRLPSVVLEIVAGIVISWSRPAPRSCDPVLQMGLVRD
jgi:Kef-type K+ transport system membrane component KefB